ncbi:MAG: NUDIX domain-containing protein [Candidatus Saccharibacteria bacterium]|nr:NUDIX domain-containing protein [Candidatus Saccharibacteria bacterium]
MSWDAKWTGRMWVAQQSVQADGRVFERVLRAPGSRIIIVKNNKLLLSREKRAELGGAVDYRLPGGKVFDTNQAYQEFIESGKDIVAASRESIAKEALEEVGVVVDPAKLEYLGVDILGATCAWDLHYWLATESDEHSEGAQYHESEAEEIEGCEWVTFEEARNIALDASRFSESRSAAQLLRWLELHH